MKYSSFSANIGKYHGSPVTIMNQYSDKLNTLNGRLNNLIIYTVYAC